MNQKTYSEIVAKRPELAVDGLVCNEATVIPGGWNVSANRPLVRAPHFVYVGELVPDAVGLALIFKHWTEMLPEKYGAVKHGLLRWGDSWAVGVDTKADGFQFLCVENTPLAALTEFWRTYEGG